jgi:hypothetical protein
MSGIRILDWRAVPRNTLFGFCKVEFPSGMIVTDITVLTSTNGPWASPPSRPMLDREGSLMRDEGSKIRYLKTIEFTSKEIRNRWSNAIIEALRTTHPEAFNE